MMTPLPHEYSTRIVRTAPHHASIHSDPRPELVGGSPPEFGGHPTDWSPEHLVLSAIGLCLETTFDAFAAREGLAVRAWVADVHGTLDRTPVGARFTRIVAHVEVTVDADTPDLAYALIARAEKACIVSRLLNVPVEVEAEVVAQRRPIADDVC